MIKFNFFLCLILFVIGCSDDNDDNVVDDDTEDPVANYVAPSYDDDYSTISSWSNRSSWNLANVHDPSVVFDGAYYYMYGTDASYGNAHDGYGHFLYRRSEDLVSWEFRGMTMSSEPAWIKDTLNNMRQDVGLNVIENPVYGFWAPVVRKVENKYRMYYSVVVDNYIASGASNTTANFDNSWTERAFIGLRETDNLANNVWIDKGMVICSVSDKGNDWSRSSTSDYNAYFKYNAIDPSYIITPNDEHWLIYGSWHSGIAAIQIDPESGKPLNDFDINDELTWGARIYTRSNTSRWQASEAPEIIYNPKTGYYYLFLAYDELSVAYNTRVCRATSVTGPYYGMDGKNVSDGAECWPMLTHPYKFNDHSGWVGISHCCIFQDETTKEWYYSSQGRLPANTNGNAYSNAIMMGHIRKIRWTEDGWPVVMPERYADVPNTDITEDDLVGAWENITLNYDYKTQQKSSTLVLSANKSVSGALSGTWTYDSANKMLTIGSLKLCVERELDWEVSSRVPTIVYSGLSSTGRPYWGKKSTK